jgi:small subunit ribosomal protein S16
MSIKIRLARLGSKRKPCYKIIVANSKAPRNGKFIERIGYINPLQKYHKYKIYHNRLKYWILMGAKVNDRIIKVIRNGKN